MLLKLEQKGLICLPLVEPIESRLSILEPLCIVPAQSREELALFDWPLWLVPVIATLLRFRPSFPFKDPTPAATVDVRFA
jgi:hypothetical protein